MNETTKQPNIFLFFGEDSFSAQEKLKIWKKGFIQKHGEDSMEIIEAKALNPQEFTTNIETLPLFADKRLMIVNDFLASKKTENQKLVARYLEGF